MEDDVIMVSPVDIPCAACGKKKRADVDGEGNIIRYLVWCDCPEEPQPA